jgi:hypothetical protein
MPLDRCRRCQYFKSDVTLAATDDRLCREFYENNERQVEEQRVLRAADEVHCNGKTRLISTTDKKSSTKSAKTTIINATAAVNVTTQTAEIRHGDLNTNGCRDELNDPCQLVQTRQAMINKPWCQL